MHAISSSTKKILRTHIPKEIVPINSFLGFLLFSKIKVKFKKQKATYCYFYSSHKNKMARDRLSTLPLNTTSVLEGFKLYFEIFLAS